MLLAAATSTGTWVAGFTLALLLIPIYIMTLKGAQSYGKLEQKVDQLAAAAESNATANAETNRLLAAAITKLTDQFVDHALQDATHFGEIKGILTPGPITG